MSIPDPSHTFVSRGGLKLAAALDAFNIDVTGSTCVDLGCNVGGFTDCLLQRGASKVFAVDTGYGALAWSLRNDDRVVVMERTNALHTEPTAPCDIAVIDLGWTRQQYAIAAALNWLKPGGQIISLIKPHYEADRRQLSNGQLNQADAHNITQRVLTNMPALGVTVNGHIMSPIRGGKGKRRQGNIEYLAHLQPHA